MFFIANLGCLFLGLLYSISVDTTKHTSAIIKRCTVDISIGLSFIVFALILGHRVLVKVKFGAMLRHFQWKRYRELHCQAEGQIHRAREGRPNSASLYFGFNEDREPLLSNMD